MDPRQTPSPQNPASQPYAPSPNPGAYAEPAAPSVQPFDASPGSPLPPPPNQSPLAAPSPYVDPMPEDPVASDAEPVPQPTEITTTISHDAPAAFEASASSGGASPAGVSAQPGLAGNASVPQPDFQGQNPAYGAYNPSQPEMNAGVQGRPGVQEPQMPPQLGALPSPGMPPLGAQPNVPSGPGAPPFGMQPSMPPHPGVPGGWSVQSQPGAPNPNAPAGQIPPMGVPPSMVAPPQQLAGPLPPVINGHNQRREPKALFLGVIGLVVLVLAIIIAYLISRGK